MPFIRYISFVISQQKRPEDLSVPEDLMPLINFHLADKGTLVIIFAKHRFICVVLFRNNDQQCSNKIFLQNVSRTVILH